MCFLPNNKLLVTGKDDQTIWDLSNTLGIKPLSLAQRVSPSFDNQIFAWTGDGYYTGRTYHKVSDGEIANFKKVSNEKDFFGVDLIEGVQTGGFLYFADVNEKIFKVDPKDPDSRKIITTVDKGDKIQG